MRNLAAIWSPAGGWDIALPVIPPKWVHCFYFALNKVILHAALKE
jgi:hypothetical protein